MNRLQDKGKGRCTGHCVKTLELMACYYRVNPRRVLQQFSLGLSTQRVTAQQARVRKSPGAQFATQEQAAVCDFHCPVATSTWDVAVQEADALWIPTLACRAVTCCIDKPFVAGMAECTVRANRQGLRDARYCNCKKTSLLITRAQRPGREHSDSSQAWFPQRLKDGFKNRDFFLNPLRKL